MTYIPKSIVMLPAETGPGVIQQYVDKTGRKGKFIVSHPYFDPKGSYWKPYHLYLLSKEEIKEGDWYFCKWSLQIYKYVKNALGKTPSILFGSRKVIATTNPDLKTIHEVPDHLAHESVEPTSLPGFEDSFLKTFCDLKGFSEVLVKYDVIFRGSFGGGTFLHSCSLHTDTNGDSYYMCCGNVYYEHDMRDLRITQFSSLFTSNNKVLIELTAENKQKSQTIDLVKRAFELGMEFGKRPLTSDINLDEWIEKNL